jgi:hypothetical protein
MIITYDCPPYVNNAISELREYAGISKKIVFLEALGFLRLVHSQALERYILSYENPDINPSFWPSDPFLSVPDAEGPRVKYTLNLEHPLIEEFVKPKHMERSLQAVIDRSVLSLYNYHKASLNRYELIFRNQNNRADIRRFELISLFSK